MDTTAPSDDGLLHVSNILPGLTEHDQTCDTHGPYRDRTITIAGRTITQGCPVCLRETADAQARERVAAIQREARQRRAESMMQRSSVPPRYHEVSFDSFELSSGPDRPRQQAAMAACRAFADNFNQVLAYGGNLLLVGGCGTGKTHLACAIINQLTRSGHSCLFTGSSALVHRVMRARAFGATVSAIEVIDELASLDLLVIDEIESFAGEGAREILIDIINARYERSRPIVVITNLSTDELSERLALRSVDRLADRGYKITFNWPSYRRKVSPITPPWMQHGS